MKILSSGGSATYWETPVAGGFSATLIMADNVTPMVDVIGAGFWEICTARCNTPGYETSVATVRVEIDGAPAGEYLVGPMIPMMGASGGIGQLTNFSAQGNMPPFKFEQSIKIWLKENAGSKNLIDVGGRLI